MSTVEHPQKRFAVDVMLGRLTKWLRVLGFDARSGLITRPGIDSLLTEGIIPVTRSVKLSDIEGVFFIHNDHHLDQLKELITSLEITADELHPFSRCSLCNAELLQISRKAALGAVPDYVFETAPYFHKCPQCGKMYWPGSHRQKMIKTLKTLGIEGAGDSGI
jgi:hypothetical protein